MLDHISEKNDAAQWIPRALGLSVIQRLDEKSTAAMWADANINYTQQRIIKRHLCPNFGKRFFIPETSFNTDHEQYYVPTYYNKYKHYKTSDKTQKPEHCQYWSRVPSLVVIKKNVECWIIQILT
jgi:hypothetical protein